MPREYSNAEIIEAAINTRMDSVHVAIPGRVLAYHPATQTVDVQPTVKMPMQNALGAVVYETLSAYANVPVAFPSGGGYFVAFPLAVGDPVMLLFSEVATGEYLASGSDSKPVDTRRHSLGYPVALPGAARPDPKALADAPTVGLVIGRDGDPAQIRMTPGAIELGKAPADFVALATLVTNELNALRTTLATHTHASFAAVGVPAPAPVGNVASTLIKAK